MDDDVRQSRYREMRSAAPELFDNPPGAPFEILLNPADVAAAEEMAAQLLDARGMPRSWAHTGVVYEDPYSVVLRDAVRMPSGRSGTYVRRVQPAGAAGVVVLPRCAGDVVLIRHFRHSTRSWHLEAPRGFGEPGSTPDQDARRELLEEIGATPLALHPLGVVHPDTGQSADGVHLFYAEIERLDAEGEAEEGIAATLAVPPAACAELIRTGAITDGFTIAAWTRALLQGLLPSGR